MKKKTMRTISGAATFLLAAALLCTSFGGLISRNATKQYEEMTAVVYETSVRLDYLNASDSGKTANISVSAESAVLIDALSGRILYEKEPDKRLPMASTTKIMTAIVALEAGVALDKVFKIPKEVTGVEGSSIYLRENERFTLEDLIYAVLLNSANDAAEAVAVCVAGNVANFAVMMNDKVKELNLKNTNFTNPHGLDDALHYTSAYDLAKISAYALKNDKFREITSTKKRVIYPKNEDGSDSNEGARFLRNHNRMLNSYQGAIGVKTGFTKRSGRCLSSAAERDNVRLVAVTINAPSDWSDHTKMLDYGFENYQSIILCDEMELSYYTPVVNGIEKVSGEEIKKDMLHCTNSEKVYASFFKYVDTDEIRVVAELPKFVYAPVKKDDVIGKVVYWYKGEIVGSTALIASEDINISENKSFIDKIRERFGWTK